VSAKQAINDKLQGSVATHLRCGGVVNNQIKNGLLLNLWVNFLTANIWQEQARAWLSHALSAPGQHTAKRRRKCTSFNIRLSTNLTKNLPVKKVLKLVKI